MDNFRTSGFCWFPRTNIVGTPVSQNHLTGFWVPVLIVMGLWSSFSKSLADLRTLNTQQALTLVNKFYIVFKIFLYHTGFLGFSRNSNFAPRWHDPLSSNSRMKAVSPTSNDLDTLHCSTIPVVLTMVWANILISNMLIEQSVHLTNINICSSI